MTATAAPVLDNDGTLLGIVSEGDLMAPEFLTDISTDHRTAADAMTREVASVVAGILTKRRIKPVPVLRDGRVVGIANHADIVRSLASSPSC